MMEYIMHWDRKGSRYGKNRSGNSYKYVYGI